MGASWQGMDMSQPQNQIVIYQPDETLRIDVRLENDTVWLTQARMGELFGVDRSVINRHIRNIYATAELLEGATCAKIAQVQKGLIWGLAPFPWVWPLFPSLCFFVYVYGQMMVRGSAASPSSASRRLTSGRQSVPESSSSPSAP